MREMKKLQKLKMAVMALVLSVACMIPAVSAQAATIATPTGLKQTAGTAVGVQYSWNAVAGATAYGCSYSTDGTNWSNEVTEPSTIHAFTGLASTKTYYVRVRAYNGTWSAYSASLAVTTAPKSCATLTESSATANSVTVTWNAVEGASGYQVWLGKGNASTSLIKTTAGSTTSLVIKGLSADTKYKVEVVPFLKSAAGYQACAAAKSNKKVYTMGSAVKKVSLTAFNPVTGEISVKWKNKAKYEDGYQVQFYSTKSKKIKTVTIKGSSVTTAGAKVTKLLSKGGKVRVRTYKSLGNGKSYGEWSGYKIIVPQATTTATKISTNAVRIDWKKVKGAKSYTVYYSTNPNGGYQKLTTVGKSATSYTFNNLDANTTYYAYVRANDVKIGKKKYDSTAVKSYNPVVVTVVETPAK